MSLLLRTLLLSCLLVLLAAAPVWSDAAETDRPTNPLRADASTLDYHLSPRVNWHPASTWWRATTPTSACPTAATSSTLASSPRVQAWWWSTLAPAAATATNCVR